jgi:DNA-nicking Smr family endonuclease
MILKNFKELGSIKVKQKSCKKKMVIGEFKGSNSQEKDQDFLLFQRAMEDVVPLNKSKKGREIVPLKHQIKSTNKENEKDNGKKYLDKFIHGEIEFEIEFTDEYIQGNVKGLDPRIFRKLKAGIYSPEAHLDLHGLTSENAYIALIEFVKKNYLAGRRCLLVIPGRGKNSPLGRGILRENLKQWITRDPLKRVVLAFSTAIPKHGGAGAVYVLLRKYKRSRGKILWERY